MPDSQSNILFIVTDHYLNEQSNLWHVPAHRGARDAAVAELLQEMPRLGSHTPRPTAAA
ncbi:MAG: hypothetical protein O2780_10170 [Proteobacteria bacterium]|jgi:hypothetical protein|nr:hypothetical protein [Pseudomonadota bacterium]